MLKLSQLALGFAVPKLVIYGEEFHSFHFLWELFWCDKRLVGEL